MFKLYHNLRDYTSFSIFNYNKNTLIKKFFNQIFNLSIHFNYKNLIVFILQYT